MIEAIVEELCTSCDICVKICPTNVFDPGRGDAPTIARAEDCQTCFLCEAYCPSDALYVAPSGDHREGLTAAEIVASGKLGRYREILGWGPGRTSRSDEDNGYQLKNLRAFRQMGGAAPTPSRTETGTISPKVE